MCKCSKTDELPPGVAAHYGCKQCGGVGVRTRIERLADKILTATDKAGEEDGMTVAEILGVLEMCKASVIEKAFQ
jgi:PHP family Zn ribbon phosphoesterase